MARYDVVVIGAGLGGLTAGAILARDGRKVLVIERSNSVGGAASSYKSGELFVEGSLHETSDPQHPRDPKHDVLTRAGVLDTVNWIPAGAFYEVRGGPLGAAVPDARQFRRGAAGARRALSGSAHEASTSCSARWNGSSLRRRRSRKARTRRKIRARLC